MHVKIYLRYITALKDQSKPMMPSDNALFGKACLVNEHIHDTFLLLALFPTCLSCVVLYINIYIIYIPYG